MAENSDESAAGGAAPDDQDVALALGAQFPHADRGAWQRLVAKVLKASDDVADPELTLASRTADDLLVAPLYTAADAPGDSGLPGQQPFVRGRTAHRDGAGWDIRTQVDLTDSAEAREQAMTDLAGGASSLWLQVGEGAVSVEALGDVLAEVHLDLAPVVLDAGEQPDPTMGLAAASALTAIAAERAVPTGDLRSVLGLDPLGHAARWQTAPELSPVVALAVETAKSSPGARTIVVDALAFHDAGASDAVELGCALAAGVEYLRALTDAGLPVAAALSQVEFRFGITADQFGGIAKLRAARRTWARVAQASGAPEAGGQRQHAVTSWPGMTRRDPWNNILRNAIAGFAAGVGGADAVTIRPFDAAIGRSDELARRIARNTHAVLIDEGNVARVTDPAGGSWYVEHLSEDLARAAWTWFQQIEAAGGMSAALASGLIADRIAASRDRQLAALAEHAAGIIGVTDFPLAGETPLVREPIPDPPDRPGLPRIRWSAGAEDALAAADQATQTAETSTPEVAR